MNKSVMWSRTRCVLPPDALSLRADVRLAAVRRSGGSFDPFEIEQFLAALDYDQIFAVNSSSTAIRVKAGPGR